MLMVIVFKTPKAPSNAAMAEVTQDMTRVDAHLRERVDELGAWSGRNLWVERFNFLPERGRCGRVARRPGLDNDNR